MTNPKHAAKRSHFQGEIPDGPHLVFYQSGWLGTALPIGGGIGVVLDPTKQDFLQRMILTEVTREKLVFKCRCNPTCTATQTYRRSETGFHAK